MIDTTVCAAPAGIAGSGRVRVPVLPWASSAVSHVVSDVPVPGGAMRTGAQRTEQALLAPRGAQPLGTATPFATSTNPYSTLGNHSPGSPLS